MHVLYSHDMNCLRARDRNGNVASVALVKYAQSFAYRRIRAIAADLFPEMGSFEYLKAGEGYETKIR